MNLGADEIKIVEHLGRIGDVGGRLWRRGGRNVAAGAGLRRDAGTHQRAGEIESRRLLRRRQMRLDLVGRLRAREMKAGAGEAEAGENGKRCAEAKGHDFTPSVRRGMRLSTERSGWESSGRALIDTGLR